LHRIRQANPILDSRAGLSCVREAAQAAGVSWVNSQMPLPPVGLALVQLALAAELADRQAAPHPACVPRVTSSALDGETCAQLGRTSSALHSELWPYRIAV
jgi:hypothetical protein